MKPERQRDLWDAINEFTVASGGSNSAINAARINAVSKIELVILGIEADGIGELERGVKGEGGIFPDWVYEARTAIKHQNENLPWLPDLLKILGWQGGTIHQALNAVSRLVEADKEANKPLCDACGWPLHTTGACMRMGCCNSH